MARYTLEMIEQLARQLFMSPPRLRIQQIEGAEYLVNIIEPSRAYPYELIVFHITRYRAANPAGGDELLPGDCLIGDLVQLIEELSGSADLRINQMGQMCWSIEQLCRRFSISPKTIKRWHRKGLVSYRALDDEGRRRKVFPERALRRFIGKNERLVKRASAFTKLTDQERESIVSTARAMVQQGATKVSDVSERIGRQMGRSAETVRYVLRRYEEHHPDERIFGVQVQPLADDDQVAIYRGYREGEHVASLAERFGRTPSSIYRIVSDMRAKDLLDRSIEYIPSDDFEAADADQMILGEASSEIPARSSASNRTSPRDDAPVYLRDLYRLPLLADDEESRLFRRYNYLKYKASKRVAAIDRDRPRSADLDEVEGLLSQAEGIKNRLIQANLRLVVSIAKRHVRRGEDLFTVISDGNLSLMKAVEKFDYTRGNKFSTYASWAIIKNYARTVPEERYQLTRYQTGHEDQLSIEPDPVDRVSAMDRSMEGVREALDHVLATLPARERSIVTQHYGLTPDGKAHTLEQIGEWLGVSKERARQIERRALKRLREALSPSILDAILT